MSASPHDPSGPTSARRLLAVYLRPHRAGAAGLVVALLIGTVLPLVGPQLLRRFVDDAAAGRPTSALVRIALGYLFIAVAGQLVHVVATYAGSRLAWTATNRLREDLIDHVIRLDLSFHVQHTAGELIERVDGDVTALGDFLSKFLFQVIGSGLLLVGVVVLVLRENVWVGAALVVFLVLAANFVVRIQQFAVPAATEEREAAAQVIGSLEERLAAAEEIRALGASEHVLRRFHDANGAAYRASLRWESLGGVLLAGTNLLFSLGAALMLGLGIVLLRRGTFTVGTVLLLFQYTTMVRRPIDQIIHQFKELQHAAAGATRVLQLFALQPTVVEKPGAIAIPASHALDVELRDVTFAYPGDEDDPVLHHVTLRVEAGRSLGLVGRTGSGKTTIARLLLRLHDVTSGRVEIGGVDVRDATAASLRAGVRLVTQDVQLFAASLRDNLTLFSPGVDDGAMVAVLDELGLGPWFRSLPAGLDTVLEPGGGVSAGEAQLLAFARVFLAEPGLVILDEASSRLDPATEDLIDRALDRLLQDRTTVIIAHRLSSLERVDDIAVIEDGRVVEHGSRAALAADPATRFGRLVALAGAAP
jgi:ABC-type multidrug transport system fused ATPase/permease subunit